MIEQSSRYLSLIVEELGLSEPEITNRLDKLERMGLVEVHPHGRVKILIASDTFSRKGGPLWKKYKKQVLDEFFNHLFNTPSDEVMFNQGQLSDTSIRLFRKKIEKLSKEFKELVEMDTTLPLEGRYATGLIIGFRPFIFPTVGRLPKS